MLVQCPFKTIIVIIIILIIFTQICPQIPVFLRNYFKLVRDNQERGNTINVTLNSVLAWLVR